MEKKTQRKDSKYKRKIRSRLKIRENFSRPRLCVFRSSRHIYGQIIDNTTGKTLIGVSSKEIEAKKEDKGSPQQPTLPEENAQHEQESYDGPSQ